MTKTILKAEPRKITGRKVNKLRREGILPANVYGKKIKSQPLQVSLSEFKKVYKKAGETSLIELQISGKTKPVLIHEVQTDPVTDTLIHADLLQVNLKEKVKAQVPLELLGEAPAQKEGIGTMVQLLQEVEVEALPNDLPDKFKVDVTKLVEIDQGFLVSDLKVPVKVKLLTSKDELIVKIDPLRKEEEVPVVQPDLVDEGVKEGEEVGGEEDKDSDSADTTSDKANESEESKK